MYSVAPKVLLLCCGKYDNLLLFFKRYGALKYNEIQGQMKVLFCTLCNCRASGIIEEDGYRCCGYTISIINPHLYLKATQCVYPELKVLHSRGKCNSVS